MDSCQWIYWPATRGGCVGSTSGHFTLLRFGVIGGRSARTLHFLCRQINDAKQRNPTEPNYCSKFSPVSLYDLRVPCTDVLWVGDALPACVRYVACNEKIGFLRFSQLVTISLTIYADRFQRTRLSACSVCCAVVECIICLQQADRPPLIRRRSVT